jgi:hypothetical protein
MEADYETPDGVFLCANHADKDARSRGSITVVEHNKAAGCDPDGYPLDGSDTPDDVYRWMDGELCAQCR